MSAFTIRCAIILGCCQLPWAVTEAKPQLKENRSYQDAAFKSLPAKLPVVLAGTQIMIDGIMVNGNGPYRFLLDTGAMGGGRVDVSLAKKLGLKQTGEVQGSDGSGRAGPTMPEYELSSLRLGSIEYKGVRVISRDYNQHGAAVRGHIDGVLGMGLFDDLLLTINYPKSEIRLTKGKLPKPNQKDILGLIEGAFVPTITINLAGRNYDAHIDTGAMGGISIPGAIADGLNFIGEPKDVGEARTVSGPFKIQAATLSGNVQIGDQVIKNPEITIAGPMRDINLGGQFLQEYTITLDLKNKRVRFRRHSTGATNWTQRDPDEITTLLNLEMGRPVIEATINGEGPYRFVLDTGAGTTVLNSDFVRHIKLKTLGTTRIGDPSNPTAIEATVHVIDKLSVGDASFSDVHAVAWEDKAIQQGIGDVQGILGLPVLAGYVLTMDFPNRTLRLSKHGLKDGDGSVVFSRTDHAIPTLTIDVDGQPVEAHLDTGNASELSLPKHLMKKLKIQREPRKAHARTASGEFELLIAQIEGDVEIAGQTIRNPEVHFNDQFKWGNIGSGLLSKFAVTIDQKNNRLRLTPGDGTHEGPSRRIVAAPPGNPNQKRYGILVAVSNAGPMEVQDIMPGSIAEKAGLKKGDLILRINGLDVASMELNKRAELLRESPVTMQIERDGKQIDLKMSFDEP